MNIGDPLIAHMSLSLFSYLQGGAEAVLILETELSESFIEALTQQKRLSKPISLFKIKIVKWSYKI
jgi:hypothetical protein